MKQMIGRLEGSTTSVGSSAQLDGSQGKLSAEKNRGSEESKFRRGRTISRSIKGGGQEVMKPRLQVMKFGGTSVGDAACIARTAQIIGKAAKESGRLDVDLALRGTTDRLMRTANNA